MSYEEETEKVFYVKDLIKTVPKSIKFDKDVVAKREDIEHVPGGFILYDCFSKNECKQLIEISEEIGYAEAPLTILENNNDHSRISKDTKSVRNAYRAMIDAPKEWMDVINQRMIDLLPQQVEVLGKLWDLRKPDPVNERFRFGKYEKGQYFKPHFDAGYAKNQDERTMLTLVFYLNDDCEGGELIFFPEGKSHALVKIPDKKEVKIKPKAGCGIMFFLYGENNFRHEGATITGTTPKYIIRSEIFYVRNQKDKEEEQKILEANKLKYEAQREKLVSELQIRKSSTLFPWILLSSLGIIASFGYWYLKIKN